MQDQEDTVNRRGGPRPPGLAVTLLRCNASEVPAGIGAGLKMVNTSRKTALNGASVRPNDLERLRRAYEAGGIEKQKEIGNLVEQYGLTRPQIHKLAFKKGLNK